MALEVVTPENFFGDIIGDLNTRRGRIESMEPQQGVAQVTEANVALRKVFGYATTIYTLILPLDNFLATLRADDGSRRLAAHT